MQYRLNLAVFSAALVLSAMIGCSQQSKDEYSAAGNDVKSAAQKTGEAISNDTKKAGEEFKGSDVGKSLSQATEKTKVALENDKVSADVTHAIGESKDIQVSNLKVDTSGKQVTLQGIVPTAAQKTVAEHLAKTACGNGCVVADKLTVGKSK